MPLIDRENPTPLYEQIKHDLRVKILNGEISQGTWLPSEHDLCDSYGVSRITITRALNDLARERLIRRIQGKGTLVERQLIDGGMDSVAGFSRVTRRQGHVPSSRILSIETLDANAHIRQHFGIPFDVPQKFTHIRRILIIDDTPAAVLTAIIPEEIGQQMCDYDLANASFYQLYELISGRKVIRNEATLTPILADPEIADLLQVDPGSAHIHYRGLSFLEGDIPIELSTGVFSGTVIEWKATLYEVRGHGQSVLQTKPEPDNLDKTMVKEVDAP